MGCQKSIQFKRAPVCVQFFMHTDLFIMLSQSTVSVWFLHGKSIAPNNLTPCASFTKMDNKTKTRRTRLTSEISIWSIWIYIATSNDITLAIIVDLWPSAFNVKTLDQMVFIDYMAPLCKKSSSWCLPCQFPIGTSIISEIWYLPSQINRNLTFVDYRNEFSGLH